MDIKQQIKLFYTNDEGKARIEKRGFMALPFRPPSQEELDIYNKILGLVKETLDKHEISLLEACDGLIVALAINALDKLDSGTVTVH